jgi:periplasmic protein TonB
MKSLGVGLAALGLSGAVHAAVFLAPIGHPGQDGTGELLINLDVTEVVAAPEVAAPEPTVTPPAGHAASWHTHTHPYPVPASHDWVPHDPSLVHPHDFAASSPHTPAEAAPAVTASDETPRFTIAIGTDDDAFGSVSTGGVPPSHEDTAEPLPEQSVDGQARLVMGLAPSYPEAARAEGVEGDVRLELVVGVSGAVESARVVRGVGHGLDEAALRAVRQFRFAPATRGGQPVRVRMGWSMQFRLQ